MPGINPGMTIAGLYSVICSSLDPEMVPHGEEEQEDENGGPDVLQDEQHIHSRTYICRVAEEACESLVAFLTATEADNGQAVEKRKIDFREKPVRLPVAY